MLRVTTYTEPIRRHVGERIREARKTSDLSLEALAAQCGTSRWHLIRLEQGRHLPRPVLLEAIAAATGHNVDWFLP